MNQEIPAEISLPLEVVWGAGIQLHKDLGHTEPWEICPDCNEDIAGRVFEAGLREAFRSSLVHVTWIPVPPSPRMVG